MSPETIVCHRLHIYTVIPMISSSAASKALCSTSYYDPSYRKLPGLRNSRAQWVGLMSSKRLRKGIPLAIDGGGQVPPPLDLTEENVKQVLADAKVELAQLFDTSVGITGKVELAELDGPFVKISLKGRFWHMRSTVLARIGNYMKQRIPEILEVDVEDDKQLDDSPENF
ncbi:Multidrug efflux pump subunit AcrB like [Quillaja saponaria]|uniref:Multidrug efflux pump subunit AcrB like n=1 Tax=Quillaja saponaria TaxID=32244 RepID=A0AAD7Q7A8_QUISA|nr:Multidrug efflux pump subunit AcrB like [Quillaja saponaria]